MRLGKIYCSSQVKNSLTISAKSLAPSHLEQEPEVWQGTAEGSGCAFCHLRPALPRWGAVEIGVLISDSSLMPLQPKQQLLHLLGQNKPSQVRHWRGKGRWKRALKQHKRGTAWQPLLQPLTALLAPSVAALPTGSQPHTSSIPAVPEARVVHPDLRASRGSQMRSAWLHRGARFSENYGNYTCKKLSEHLEASMQLQVNSITLTHHKAVLTTHHFFSPQGTIFSQHRKLTGSRDPPAECSDV